MAYKAPVRDLTFILNEVLEIDRYTNQPGFQDYTLPLIACNIRKEPTTQT